MKFILFLIFATGAAPVTPEHHFAATAEFDDRVMCEAALEGMQKIRRYRVEGICLPKSSAGMLPEARQRFEDRIRGQK